jgi:hypothetical protein
VLCLTLRARSKRSSNRTVRLSDGIGSETAIAAKRFASSVWMMLS